MEKGIPLQKRERKIRKLYIKGSFTKWKHEEMVLNENLQQFEYHTRLAPGPQKFIFLEDPQDNTKQIRKIIIKPREKEIDLDKPLNNQNVIRKLRRTFVKLKSVFNKFLTDNIILQRVFKEDWSKAGLKILYRNQSHAKLQEIEEIMTQGGKYKQLKDIYLSAMYGEKYEFIQWQHLEQMIKAVPGIFNKHFTPKKVALGFTYPPKDKAQFFTLQDYVSTKRLKRYYFIGTLFRVAEYKLKVEQKKHQKTIDYLFTDFIDKFIAFHKSSEVIFSWFRNDNVFTLGIQECLLANLSPLKIVLLYTFYSNLNHIQLYKRYRDSSTQGISQKNIRKFLIDLNLGLDNYTDYEMRFMYLHSLQTRISEEDWAYNNMEFTEFLEFLVRLAHKILVKSDLALYYKVDKLMSDYLAIVRYQKQPFDDDDDYVIDD